MSDTREIKGEIESWANEIREFGKNNRGSRGLKVDGDWHNVVGRNDELIALDQTFPKGTFVKFKEKKNTRGYWDVDGQILKINKEETYAQSAEKISPSNTKQEKIPMNQETAPVKDINTVRNFNQNKDTDILFAVSFKGAVEAITIFYKKYEGVIDLDKVTQHIITETGKIYMGLKQKKIQLQEAGEW